MADKDIFCSALAGRSFTIPQGEFTLSDLADTFRSWAMDLDDIAEEGDQGVTIMVCKDGPTTDVVVALHEPAFIQPAR